MAFGRSLGERRVVVFVLASSRALGSLEQKNVKKVRDSTVLAHFTTDISEKPEMSERERQYFATVIGNWRIVVFGGGRPRNRTRDSKMRRKVDTSSKVVQEHNG